MPSSLLRVSAQIFFAAVAHAGSPSDTGHSILHRAVDFGACFDTSNDEVVRCALGESECTGSLRFLPAIQMRLKGLTACEASDVAVGTCGSTCVSGPEHCGGTFSTGGECTIESASYGACLDGTTGDISCMLHASDCRTSEAWITIERVKELGFAPCRCDRVSVGLCGADQHGGGQGSTAFCAATGSDCLHSGFLTAVEAINHDSYPGHLACHLCDPLPAQPIAAPIMAPASTPQAAPVSAPTPVASENNADESDAEKTSASDSSVAGVAIGAGLGGAIAAVAIIAGIVACRRRRSMAKAKEAVNADDTTEEPADMVNA